MPDKARDPYLDLRAQDAASEGLDSSGTEEDIDKRFQDRGGIDSFLNFLDRSERAVDKATANNPYVAPTKPAPPAQPAQSREAADPSDIPGTKEYQTKQLGEKFDLSEGWGTDTKLPTAPQSPPPNPQPLYGASGGASGLGAAFGAQFGGDIQGLEDAYGREKLGRTTEADLAAQGEGQLADLRRNQVQSLEAAQTQSDKDFKAHFDEIVKMTHDYPEGKADPWGGMPIGQQIATRIGAGLLSAGSVLAGGSASAGVDMINRIMNRNIAMQQQQLEQKRYKIGVAQNMLQYFMEHSKSKQEAIDKLQFVQTDAVMHDVAKSVAGVRGNIQAAQLDEVMATLKMQRDEAYTRAYEKAAGGGGGALGGAGGFIPIENGAHVVEGPDGQQYLLGMGGEQVATSVATSERAAKEAENLAGLMDHMPSPTNWNEYQTWIGQVREGLKNVAVLGSAHLGSGGAGNIARMKAYAAAVAGPDNDPAGVWGSVAKYPEFAAGLNRQIKQNALDLARTVREDNLAILHAHNATPGQVAMVPAHGTGEFKGMGVTKEVFVPGTRQYTQPQKAPEQDNPYKNFKPNQSTQQ